MKSTYTAAAVLTLVFVLGAFADGLASLSPVYKPVDIVSFLDNPKVKKELKITKEQDTAVKASLATWRQKQTQDADTIFKMTGSGKEAKVRALGMQRAEEIFQAIGQVLKPAQVKRLKQILLQQWGIGVFNHPEIRAALKLRDEQVVMLKSIHDQMAREILKDANAGRISRQEAEKQYNTLSKGVPDRVRTALTEEQRKTLKDLLGEPYLFQ